MGRCSVRWRGSDLLPFCIDDAGILLVQNLLVAVDLLLPDRQRSLRQKLSFGQIVSS